MLSGMPVNPNHILKKKCLQELHFSYHSTFPSSFYIFQNFPSFLIFTVVGGLKAPLK